MRLKYLVFDLDETLYPRNTGLMKAINERIRHYMVEKLGFDPATVEEIRSRYYQKYGTSLRGLLVEHHIDPEDYLAYVHDLPLERYLSPNSDELRRALSRIELEKVIFTNASREHALRVLRFMSLEGFFSRIVDIRDIGYISKPAPEAFRRFLKIMDAKGEECILVEDSLRNLRVAKEFGMITVLVDGEGAEYVDFVIDNPALIEGVVREVLHAAQGKSNRES